GGKMTMQIKSLISDELKRAKAKWPGWPTDPVHAAAIVAEEAGELVQAALQCTYEGSHSQKMVDEAIQVAAMAIRFLEGIPYTSRKSEGVE
ncbi:MAG: hypothetical protein ACWGMZ_10745, partial [Thermoguttaceae bacterium]